MSITAYTYILGRVTLKDVVFTQLAKAAKSKSIKIGNNTYVDVN